MPMALRAPRLRWRHRGPTSTAYWICPVHLVKKGYEIRSQRLWKGPVGTKPTDEEMIEIMRHCHRLTREAEEWNKNPNQRKSPKYRQNGVIYFLSAGDRIKIGFTSTLGRRMSQLRISNPDGLELLGTLPGNRYIEEFVHWIFRASRESGEWFRFSDELATFIRKNVTKTEMVNAEKSTKNETQSFQRLGGDPR